MSNINIKKLGINSLIDDKLKMILGFDNLNNNLREYKEIYNKSIINKSLKSKNNVDLFIFEENIKKKETFNNLNFIKESYKKIYYSDKIRIPSYSELIEKSYNLFLNKIQGGKYIENYSEYEILVLFIVRLIELDKFCIDYYKSSTYLTKEEENNNFYIIAYNSLYKELSEYIVDFNYFHKKIEDIYVKMRKSFDYIGFKLYDDNKISIFNEQIEKLKKIYSIEQINNINEKLFKNYDASLKTMIRKLCVDDLGNDFTIENYIKCYAKKMKPENNYYQMQYEFLHNIILNKVIPKELLKLETSFIEFNSYKDKFENDVIFIKHLIESISHTILGFSSHIGIFRYFSFVQNVNMLSGYYDWIKSKKLDKASSCGLLGDFNLFSNLFYAILSNKYNKEQLFSCRFVLPNKTNEYGTTKYLDLSECKKNGDKINFSVHKSSRPQGIIKYEDTIAVLILKSHYKWNNRVKILLIKESYGKHRFFNIDIGLKIYDIYANELEFGTLLEKKPTTHYEFLMIKNIYNSICYSIELKDKYDLIQTKKYSVNDEYKGVKSKYNPYKNYGDFLNINKIYENNTIFFSNKYISEILERFESKYNTLFSKLFVYRIKEKRDYNNKFINFELELKKSYFFTNNHMGGNYSELEKKYLSETNIPNNLLKNLEIYDKIVKEKEGLKRDVYPIINASYKKNLIHLSRNLSKHISLTNLLYSLPKNNYLYYIINEIINKFNISLENKNTLEITNSINIFSQDFKEIKNNNIINFINTLNKDIRTIKNIEHRNKKLDEIIRNNSKNKVNIVFDNIYDIPYQNIDKVDFIFLRNNINNVYGKQYVNYLIILTTYLKCINKYCIEGGTVIFDFKLITLKYQYQIYHILKKCFKQVNLFRPSFSTEFITQGNYAVCIGFTGEIKEINDYFNKLKNIYPKGVNDKLNIKKDIFINKLKKNIVNEITKFNNSFAEQFDYYQEVLQKIKKYKTGEKQVINLINNEQKINTIKYLEKENIPFYKNRIIDLNNFTIELIKTNK